MSSFLNWSKKNDVFRLCASTMFIAHCVLPVPGSPQMTECFGLYSIFQPISLRINCWLSGLITPFLS